MQPMHDPNQNHLLAALSSAEFERASPHLELMDMPLGGVLCESGVKLQWAYFPTTAVVSLRYLMKNGAASEIASVGNEGVIGTAIFMGGNTMLNSAIVHIGGHGYRLKSSWLMEGFNHSGPMMHLLLRYTQALMTQIAQTAVCNRYHSVDQQLCRWLLLTLDRMPSGELPMTQELIASILGVRREGITEAARHLWQAGLISYRRGHISVLERSGLEARACECYQAVRHEFDRLLCDVRHRQELLPF